MNKVKGKQYKVTEICNPLLNINVGDTVEIISENDSDIVEGIDRNTCEWFIIDKNTIDNYFEEITA